MPGAGDAALAAGRTPDAGAAADAPPRFGHRFPYPGLRPFEDHEFDLFYGRTDQVDEIIGRILETHFASVLGGSGCGKSSLIRAGVIPELRFRGDTWLQVVFNAGQRPLTRLAEALSAVLVKPAGDAAGRTGPALRRLLTQQNGLAAVVDEFREDFIVRVRPDPPDGHPTVDDENDRRRLSANAKLLILIDQFEEVFAAETEEERFEASQIVQLIVDSFELRHPSVYLVLAMRSENLHSCTAYLNLPRVINRSSYLVRRLDDSEIGRAIVEPARYCRKCMLASLPADAGAHPIGAAEFDPEVVRRLREEVRLLRDDVDHLPLLQHALFRLWEAALARERIGGDRNAPLFPERVTVEDLETASSGPTPAPPGGSLLRRCVEVHANRLFHSLDPREQRVAESAFRLLGTVDENRLIKRRRTRVAEILSTSPRGTTSAQVEKVIRRFRTPHPYLRVQRDDIDVAHEAFIRNWKQFGDWIRGEAARRQCYEMLVDRLRKWQAAYRDPSASQLARGTRWFRDLLDRHARAEASAHGIARLEPVRVTKYLREIGEDPGAVAADAQPPLHREILRFLGLSVTRARAIWSVFALLVVAPLALYGLAMVEGRQKADLDKEAKAFHSLAVSSTSGNAQHALLPLEERTMRLWEVLAAVHARGSQEPDEETGGLASRIIGWLGLDFRDRRLMRAMRLSGRQAQDALRTILTSSVWPTRLAEPAALEADLPLPTETACTRESGEARKGFLLVSGDDPTRRLFFVPVEGAVYVAESVPGEDGACQIGQPILRVAGRTDVKADPALRMLVEMSKASASQGGAAAAPADAPSTSKFAYSFYRVRWSCRLAAVGAAPCADWNAELVRAGSFDTQLDEPRAWGVMANGGGFKVIERDGEKRGGMEYAAPFDPVSPADPANVASYFTANADSQESCVAQFESVRRASPAGANATVVAPIKQLREAQYCAEIGSLSATDQVVNVYALPVSWQAAIASGAQAGAPGAGQPTPAAQDVSTITAKRHLLRFPAASFAFQSPQIRRAAFGVQALEGYLVLETAEGKYLTLLWDLGPLYRKGCDVLYQPALINHLERVKYTTQGRLRKDERPVHPVFAFLAGSSEEAVLEKAIDAPCETGAPSMPATQR